MRDWLESIDARNKAQSKYDKKNTSGFYMKLNIRTDADVIRRLWKQPSEQGTVKRLIREEIARESNRTAGLDQNPAGIITWQKIYLHTERERSQGERGIPQPCPLGEDMPRKPLDVVTRIILWDKERQRCSPASPTRSGVWGGAPRTTKAPSYTVLMFLNFWDIFKNAWQKIYCHFLCSWQIV